ncbi:AAA ATPase central domain protein [Methanocaldococcus vulcanius M7]|uniref:Replication factor C large subunit n=1 Tax=Methanocaldococcus vulcanius (strain ATCC 700851 / DSM 12094 / M7) TaxID=579137 RepID=C9RI36_METVM|nr:replication factor C large subunit [Methanocaldococcus vulcanius]ACX73238.1 AAA ATPase central domain protein [Methanocaldococcus vulcanius M7]
MLSWVEKYRPRSLKDVAGHEKVKEKLKTWIESYLKGENPKPILLVGPPGCGKTTLAYALANDYGFEVIELNASDKRNSSAIKKVVGHAATSSSIFGKKFLIVLDEVDGISGKEDAGGVSELIKIIKKAKNPIILTANDAYATSIRSLLPYVEIIQLNPVHTNSIYKVLKKIAQKEGLDVDDKTLKMIAQHSAGDLRSAINDLEALALSGDLSYETVQKLPDRKREANIFDALRVILKTTHYGIATTALMNVDETPDVIIEWIAENVPKEYEKAEEVARAFEYLSKADRYLGRVMKRQNYGFWKYATTLMTAGVALSKDEKYRKWTPYSYPKIFRLLTKTKAEREILNKILKKIGEKTHTSSKRARFDLQILEILAKENPYIAADLVDYFEIKEDELKALFGERLSSKLLKILKEKKKKKSEKNKREDKKDKKNEDKKEVKKEIIKKKKEDKKVEEVKGYEISDTEVKKDIKNLETQKQVKKEKEIKEKKKEDKKKENKGKQLTLDAFFK